jgi:hypothetical protein
VKLCFAAVQHKQGVEEQTTSIHGTLDHREHDRPDLPTYAHIAAPIKIGLVPNPNLEKVTWYGH